MKTYCYYHDEDMDGICSGAIVKKFVKDVDFIKVSSSNISCPDFSFVASDDTVYIVDLSVSLAGLRDLLERSSNIIWIDHHLTSLTTLKSLGDCSGLKTLLSVDDGAACVLVWQWFNDMKAYPQVVHLVSQYDTWQYSVGDPVMLFNLGCENLRLNPDSSLWFNLLQVSDKESPSISHIMEVGSSVYDYQKSRFSHLVSCSFHIEWCGVKFLAINTDNSNIYLRKVGVKSIDEWADCLLLYHRVGDRWLVNMYGDQGNTIDLSLLAGSHGGGGHFNAAGFVTNRLPAEFLEG